MINLYAKLNVWMKKTYSTIQEIKTDSTKGTDQDNKKYIS